MLPWALSAPHPKLAAEVLFLRKQLALYEERQVKPRRATDATRIVMVWLSHFFNWRRLTHRETGDVDALASSGLPLVLALEIQTWSTPSLQTYRR